MKAFQCQMCGHCCYGQGGIFLEKGEMEDIAGFLVMSVDSFLARFCEENMGRLQLKTGRDKFCIFFSQEKKCLIHPVKPGRCRRWPFAPAVVRDEENWEIVKGTCPGIHPGCSFEAFVRQSKEWT